MGWMQDIEAMTKDDWELYDRPGVGSTARTLNNFLGLLAQHAFQKMKEGDYDIAEAHAFVDKEFASFRTTYHQFGASDTAVNEVADTAIKKIFNI